MAMTLSMLGRRIEAWFCLTKAFARSILPIGRFETSRSLLLRWIAAEEALVNFEQALSMAPHFDFRLNRGVALAQLRRFVEAIAEFDACWCSNPGRPTLISSRQCVTALGRVERGNRGV